MNITEILIFAKILAAVSVDRTVMVTSVEKKIAADALKRIADQRFDWTQAATGTVQDTGGCG